MRPLPKLILVVIAVVTAILAGWWIAKQLAEAPPPAPAANSGQEPVGQVSDKRTVHLYFGDTQGRYLVAEQRVVTPPADDVALARLLIELLIQGPKKEGSRTLPADAHLRALHVTGTGTAFIDLEEASLARHPGGVGNELLSIYSVVNTLVLNVEKIRTVKFLIGGREAATLVDHVDLREPFEVDMLWVR
ncbi:MAG: GerMN domain-containing protein [Desulfobacterales bacterium]|nr:GerMN domain-containing protein [Desulfobacterales bacterium]